MTDNKAKEKLGFCGRMEKQCRSFANFAYNKQTGEVMGRSGKSWAKIGLFYLAYYSFLAAFFSSCLAVFLSTLNDPGKGGPKTTQFLIGDSAPGINTVPAVKNLKEYKKTESKNTKEIQGYLDGFKHSGFNGGNCSDASSTYPCKYDLSLLKNCSGIDTQYGYGKKMPCVFIKINKVFDWKPKKDIELHCTAENGKVTVMPSLGYLAKLFPFKGQEFYKTPPVALVVDNSKGGKTTVKCELKGDGITTSDVFRADRAFGKIEFEVEGK